MAFVAVALGIGGAVAGIGGALISSSGAQNAASTQANAANHAADLQYQLGEQSLGFNQQQYANTLAMMQPYLQSGYSGLANLDYLMGLGTGGPTPGTAPNPQAGNIRLQPGGITNGVPNATTAAGAGTFGNGAPIGQGNDVLRLGAGGPAAAGSGLRPMIQTGVRDAINNPSNPDSEFVAQPPGVTQGAGGVNPRAPLNSGTETGMTTVPANDPALQGPGGTAPVSGTSALPGAQVSVPSLSTLVNPNLGAAGSLLQGYGPQFSAPTGLDMQNDPGYLARMQLGTDALQHSAAAQGGLLSGGTMKDLINYGQTFGSNEYGNVYNRALSTYNTNANTYWNNQSNEYNKLASLAGLGQTSTTQLGTAGQNAANTNAGISSTIGNQVGSNINNAGAARASGYVGSANAIGGAVNNIGGNLGNLYMLSQLASSGGGGGLPASIQGGVYDPSSAYYGAGA